MIPAVIVGLFFEKQINSFFSGNLTLVGSMLLITGILLLVSDFVQFDRKKITFKNSFFIGLSQAIAILPGISRSGATIATAVIIGVDREKAARFSFLMVVPLIFGGMFKSILSTDISFENFDLITVLLGFFSAFFTGLLACRWMITLVKKSKLYYFSIYCFVVGLFLVFYTL
jgi:undecaprenyl-diphosphatase